MAKSFATSSTLAGDLARPGKSSLCSGDRRLSRAERMEIISLVAAVGVNEFSAWLIPMLERGGHDEGSTME